MKYLFDRAVFERTQYLNKWYQEKSPVTKMTGLFLSDKWFVGVSANIADCRSAATGSIPVRTAIIKNQFYAHSCNEIVSKDFIEETIM